MSGGSPGGRSRRQDRTTACCRRWAIASLRGEETGVCEAGGCTGCSHRLFDQRFRRIRQNIVGLAEDRLLADFQHDRHGERRDAFEPLMHDSPADRESISPSRAMSSSPVAASARVAWSRMWSGSCVAALVDEVGRDRDLPAGLLLAGMAPLDQPDDLRSCGRCASAASCRQPCFEVVAEHLLVEQLGERGPAG